jgi:dephospho-CoA kinase
MSHVSLPRFCDRFCIGLTGGIASGKSTASERLAQLGAAVVDTDVIAHQLTQAGGAAMPAIEHAFGKDFINLDGSLNRTAMRALVFAEPLKRSRLEAILHPMIHAKPVSLALQLRVNMWCLWCLYWLKAAAGDSKSTASRWSIATPTCSLSVYFNAPR